MGQLIGWTLYFVFLVTVVMVGWEQPLKTQFGLKPTAPPAAVAAPLPKTAAAPSWMNDNQRWDNRRSAP